MGCYNIIFKEDDGSRTAFITASGPVDKITELKDTIQSYDSNIGIVTNFQWTPQQKQFNLPGTVNLPHQLLELSVFMTCKTDKDDAILAQILMLCDLMG